MLGLLAFWLSRDQPLPSEVQGLIAEFAVVIHISILGRTTPPEIGPPILKISRYFGLDADPFARTCRQFLIVWRRHKRRVMNEMIRSLITWIHGHYRYPEYGYRALIDPNELGLALLDIEDII